MEQLADPRPVAARRQADCDDQRLLRPAASRPRGLADSSQARRLPLVAVNSDRSVREIKGPGRPVVDEQGRTEMLAALACVDYVVVFDEASVAGLVERSRPRRVGQGRPVHDRTSRGT